MRRCLWLMMAVGWIVGGRTGTCGDQPASSTIAESKTPVSDWGIDKRIPWTSSRVVGAPEPPPPFRGVRAFPKLTFANPLYLMAEPATAGKGEDTNKGRLFVVEQRGRIAGFKNDAQVDETVEFLKLKDRETYGMMFHPKYAENRWVYVFSNLAMEDDKKRKRNRVSRFTVGREPPFVCDVDSETIIIEWESNGHNGGDMAIGPDGMLYISAGDGTSDSDTNLTGQKISDLNSGMIRIDIERPDPGKAYAIPKDNPFVDIPDARHELWAYGFRNPWRIHFDPQGNLWCGDIGQDQWEMIEIVRRGDNYGWSIVEGGYPFYLERQPGPHPIVKPLIALPHSEARSITGGVTYLGTKFPDLRGAYVYGDFATGKIWAARYDGKQLTENREIADTEIQVLGFGIDRDGEIYLVDYAGLLWTLERTPPETNSRPFPRKLSETGVFQSVRGHVVDLALVPYSVNSALWSDHAHKERFIGLPGTSQIEFTENGAWHFPEGAVLVKSFALETEVGNTASRKWIETRLLVIQQKEWAGYSYLWNDEQTDAELVASSGADKAFTIRDAAAPDGKRTQVWHYPSRTECMVCHSRAAGFVLGLNTLQMNRDHDYGGKTANQLSTLEHIGALRIRTAGKRTGGNDPRNLDEEGWKFADKLPKRPAEYARLPDPADETADLEARVRSYLHANCAQCHVSAGGGNSAMELAFKAARDKVNIIDVPPLHDKFGLPDARIIAPGAPERSVMLARISRRGKGQMPPLATAVPDEAGIRLMRRWIEELGKSDSPSREQEKKAGK